MILYLIRHAESRNNRLALNLSYDEYMKLRTADPPLSELGEEQAERLAAYLKDPTVPDLFTPSAEAAIPGDDPSTTQRAGEGTRRFDGRGGLGISHLYCSPMLRTLQTVHPTAVALGLQPEIWTDIHEHGGMFLGNPRTGEGLEIFPGLARREISERFPACVLPESITDEGWWTGGYEDIDACFGRATRVARRLRKRARENAEQGIEERIALVSHGTFLDTLLKAFFNQVPDQRLYYQHYNTGITRLDFMNDGTILLRYLNRTQHLPPNMLSM